MKESEILSNIAAKLGITSLKPMQIELAAASAPRITLAAPTGSGKTVAFTIQLLKRMPQPGRGVAAVVMAPSRELVLQIASVVPVICQARDGSRLSRLPRQDIKSQRFMAVTKWTMKKNR